MAPIDTGSRRLANTFNFRVALRRSAGPPAGASAGLSLSASASVSVGAGGFSASAQASASFGVSTGGDLLGDGGFQECSGLEISMDVQQLEEGGRNDGVIQRVGRGKYSNIVLKRGFFYDSSGQVNAELWRWLQGILSGVRPVLRYDGVIEVLDASGEGDDATVLATWTFDRGLPSKLVGPQLNARSGEIAIEELHIAHEGLRLSI
ncbi:phage tail protein [Hyalangium versicolor]|uniref:phage tail protein n=1 Tax=Hyalangium versicolor TaxID=2861190 RepID=UPI001CCF8DAF|nr:phage tail protein [Hyalangium versicolor]